MSNGHRKRPPAAAIIAVVLAAMIGGYFWWHSSQPAETDGLSAAGAVEAKEYQIASMMSGRVTVLAVNEGDVVEAGDTLAELDATVLELQLEQAKQGVIAAEAGVASAEDSGTEADVTVAQAILEQARAAVTLAEVQLGYATVTAPHSGVVVAITTNAGQNANPGKTLVTLRDPDDLFARVFVPETRIGDVRLGQQVSVTTDSSDSTFAAEVFFIASEAEFTPSNVETKEQRVKLVYEVRVRISDTTGTLKAGMPVDVTFE